MNGQCPGRKWLRTVKIEINQLSNTSDAAHISSLLHEFISQKMAALEQAEHKDPADSVSQETIYKKYQTSLLMLFYRFNIMSQAEIARSAGIAGEQLNDWNREDVFGELVSWNYREFLEFVVDLFA